MKYNKRHPNYILIYSDIVRLKYPEKWVECEKLLNKSRLSVMDIIKLNHMIFNTDSSNDNKKYRSYSKIDILDILRYQKINGLNNSELSKHFGLSRNTIAKWKRLFTV